MPVEAGAERVERVAVEPVRGGRVRLRVGADLLHHLGRIASPVHGPPAPPSPRQSATRPATCGAAMLVPDSVA